MSVSLGRSMISSPSPYISILLRLKGFEMDGTEIARGVQPIIIDLLGGSGSTPKKGITPHEGGTL